MARIDTGHHGTIVDAKRGQRPVQLIAPHTGPHHAPAPDHRQAVRQQRAAGRARARQRFAAAYANAREKARRAL